MIGEKYTVAELKDTLVINKMELPKSESGNESIDLLINSMISRNPKKRPLLDFVKEELEKLIKPK